MFYPKTFRKNKLGNRKTIVDAITFDSAKEARRYSELKIMQRAGLISDLIIKPRFELVPKFKINGISFRKMEYEADYQYTENGEMVIEDVKGFKTEVYKMKKKLLHFKFANLCVKFIFKET